MLRASPSTPQYTVQLLLGECNRHLVVTTASLRLPTALWLLSALPRAVGSPHKIKRTLNLSHLCVSQMDQSDI